MRSILFGIPYETPRGSEANIRTKAGQMNGAKRGTDGELGFSIKAPAASSGC